MAIAATGLATGLSLALGGASTAGAAVVHVLAVTVAAALGGLQGGLIASVLSFLSLNFFFTAPVHTFSVAKVEDLVALVVFLVVSGIVGTLFSSVVVQRARAEQREREAVFLQRLGARLLGGESVETILQSFARAAVELLPLNRCEIITDLLDSPVVADRPGRAGDQEAIPLTAGDREVGRIVLTSTSPPDRLRDSERNVVRAFAAQMGLALEGMRLGGEAAEARMEAETNRLRAALFSSVTHDLRTPLASITASVTSLLDDPDAFSAKDREDLLETIRQEAERLNRLVGNLLDISRIRAGALVPAKSPGAIDELIEGTVARVRPLLDGREVRLMLRDDLPVLFMDVVQIDQVLTNVLENAVKFSPPGSPITVSAARWQDSVEVRVSDRGPGIPPDDRDRVFELFVAGDDQPGSGLGLAIGRAIIESHGGRIWIEGTPGGGCTVVFQLPVGEGG